MGLGLVVGHLPASPGRLRARPPGVAGSHRGWRADRARGGAGMRVMPRTRGGALWRFLLAAVLIIGATAATTAVAGLLQFKQLAADLNVTPSLPNAAVTLPPPGAPQTILIIGSDHRAGTPYNAANTDTMLLVRLDAGSRTINVMSIPRDLQVQIPGFGTAKLNAAYADGGPNLLIKTIRENVFANFHPSHLVDVNFGGLDRKR